MNFVLDAHTHTLASGHAYNTLNEMIKSAQEKGLELLGVTEHGPNMPGSCHQFYFSNFRVIPRQYDNLRLFLGAELNIMDIYGTIDLDDYVLDEMDHIIASLHKCCLPAGTSLENTEAVLNAIQNPYVNIIGHPDEDLYNLDYDAIVQSAKEHDVLLELNNSSLLPTSFRAGARENDITLLNTCKKYGASIILGSDAHISHLIKHFDEVNILLKETDFPEELIVNTSKDKFIEFINRKRINIPKHVY
jgi:putative hydrolase